MLPVFPYLFSEAYSPVGKPGNPFVSSGGKSACFCFSTCHAVLANSLHHQSLVLFSLYMLAFHMSHAFIC